MRHQVRVIFGDTDQMGVVYYANYLRWFESARAAYLREHGLSGRDLAELGVGFPVAEAHCRYRRPAHYEDLLDVDITLTELKGAQVRFEYRVVRPLGHPPHGVIGDAPALRGGRGEELLADGWTVHACVSTGGSVVRIPERLRVALAPG